MGRLERVRGMDFSGGYSSFEKMEESRLGVLRRDFYKAGDEPEAWKILEGRVRDNTAVFRDETLGRILADSGEISERIFKGRSFREIQDITWPGADFHNHGRCSLRIGTDQGIFYYKPRESRLDGLYCQIADRWFGDVTSVPALILRDGYSYVSNVENQEVRRAEDIAGYYHNFGVMLALFRSLASSDLHGGNIIACGDRPVVIDMETMLTPQLDKDWIIRPPVYFVPDKYITHSFMDTCVLPTMVLGGLQFSPLYSKELTMGCLPMIGNELRTVEEYREEFIAGFKEGYGRVMKIRRSLRDLLDENNDIAFRYVLRPTAYYERMLGNLLAPESMTDPGKKEEVYKRLGRRFAGNDPRDTASLMKWERASLEEGDFPYYHTRLGSRDLYGSPEHEPLIRGCFQKTALDRAAERLDLMGDEEELFEEELIRLCFRHTDRIHSWYEVREHDTEHVSEPGSLSAEVILGEADRIVPRIKDMMVTTPEGRSMWFGGHKATDARIGSAAPGNGCGGIALFLKKYLMHDGTERELAEKMLEKCMGDIELYLKMWEREKQENDRYGDKQAKVVSGLETLMRCLKNENPDMGEAERLLFGDIPVETELPDTDIVDGGRAGLSGRLLLAYHDIGDETDLLRAGEILTVIYADKQKSGQYTTRSWPYYNSEDPSFYFGESGIGYVMLWYMELAGLTEDTI